MNFFFFSEFYFDLKILYQIIGYFGADISLSWISQFNRKILLNFAAREREREREREGCYVQGRDYLVFSRNVHFAYNSRSFELAYVL